MTGNDFSEKIKQVEDIHKDYLKELKEVETEEHQAIREFLEMVKEKKIGELKQKIMLINPKDN